MPNSDTKTRRSALGEIPPNTAAATSSGGSSRKRKAETPASETPLTRHKHVLAGCDCIDSLLPNEGIDGKTLEIFGKAATGKTQLCFNFATETASKRNSTVVWIDVSGSFRATRITDIARSKGYNENLCTDQVRVAPVRSKTLEEVQRLLNRARQFSNVKLLLIDSLGCAFKTTRSNIKDGKFSARKEGEDGPGKNGGNGAKPTGASAKLLLSNVLNDVKAFQETKKCTVILVNDVVADMGAKKKQQGGRKYDGEGSSAGGNSFVSSARKNAVKPVVKLGSKSDQFYRLKLSRGEVHKKRKATFVNTSGEVENENLFEITKDGFEDQ